MLSRFHHVTMTFIVVSIAYFLASFVALGVLAPLYEPYKADIPPYVNLVFLPHGVRVLAAWLLGWRAIPYLYPSTYLCTLIFVEPTGLFGEAVIGPMIGLVATVFIFWVAKKLRPDLREALDGPANWRDVMLIGCIASVVNMTMIALGTGDWNLGIVGIFFGDVTGMIACMVVLMIAFKAIRGPQS
ncbi:hypothetical protein [Pseudooctadecabacter sp.]|uniref:hypothetical protein n=1 Tax=Pseudooctadecabacter sp. TaxID=1966338 RepID=UPI0025D42E37|nr:hypothetical protein [Pseudooctadecabacter sp.]